jgi:hypothetical protein
MSELIELLPLGDRGVSQDELTRAERRLGRRLPEDLRNFLRISDGSNWMDFPGCGFMVLPLADLMGLWELPEDHRAGPSRLIDIASDGSRERFCLDPASDEIVMLDITWQDGDPPTCATSLTDLVVKLAGGWDPFEIYK